MIETTSELLFFLLFLVGFIIVTRGNRSLPGGRLSMISGPPACSQSL